MIQHNVFIVEVKNILTSNRAVRIAISVEKFKNIKQLYENEAQVVGF
jgi:hypothetical protein